MAAHAISGPLASAPSAVASMHRGWREPLSVKDCARPLSGPYGGCPYLGREVAEDEPAACPS